MDDRKWDHMSWELQEGIFRQNKNVTTVVLKLSSNHRINMTRLFAVIKRNCKNCILKHIEQRLKSVSVFQDD